MYPPKSAATSRLKPAIRTIYANRLPAAKLNFCIMRFPLRSWQNSQGFGWARCGEEGRAESPARPHACHLACPPRIISMLSTEERGLFRERIRYLDRKIHPGLKKLLWSLKGASTVFISECRLHASKVSRILKASSLPGFPGPGTVAHLIPGP